jgi:hypothetical protein
MHFLNKLSYSYVLAVLVGLSAYAKWCERNASSQTELAWLVLGPVIALGGLQLMLPEPLRRLVAALFLAPFIHVAAVAAVGELRSRW